MIITRLPTSIIFSVMNKYVVNNTTKFNKQQKFFFVNYHLYDNKRYFTSSKSFKTSISSLPEITTPISTTTTTTPTPTPTTTTTVSSPITTTTTTISSSPITTSNQVEIIQRLVKSNKDESKNILTFSEVANLLIKESIDSGNNEMKSIMWIYDRFNDDNVLTFETKNLIILELLKYNQKKKAIIIMQKLLNDDNYIPKPSLIQELFENLQNNDCNHLDLIKNLFNTVIKKEIHQLEYHKLYAKMIDLECLAFNMDNAIMYFKEIREKMGIEPDAVIYLSLINGLAKRDMMNKAEEYFNLMIQEKISPTIEIFTTLINHHLRLLNIEKAEQLFQIMKSYNIKPNIIIYNAIINNSVIKLDMETAEKFFNEIIESGIKPDVGTFSTLLKGYLNAGDTVKALQVNNMMKDYGIEPNRVYAILLTKVYIQNKDFEKVFSSMFEDSKLCVKNLTLYLKFLLQKADKNSAYELYKDNLEKFDNYAYKFTPDAYFFTTFISSFAQQHNDMSLAIELFEEMKHREIKPSIVTYSILIDGFALKGQVDKAVEYFEKMKREDSIEPNVYTYTSLIKAWIQVRKVDKVKEVYGEMISKNIQPVSATIRAIQKLLTCSSDVQENLIEQPPESQKEAHYWGSKLWISKDIEAVDRLFQSFSFSISNSQHVDDKPNVKTFRYFITCYLFKYKNLTRALEVFHEMLKLNVKPDYLLYRCFIKGCCMLGQVEKSIPILEMMTSQNFIPDYYIYIDLIRGWERIKRFDVCHQLHKELIERKRINFTKIDEIKNGSSSP